jgi:hypothetical protein
LLNELGDGELKFEWLLYFPGFKKDTAAVLETVFEFRTAILSYTTMKFLGNT